jgi:hypothetical protein
MSGGVRWFDRVVLELKFDSFPRWLDHQVQCFGNATGQVPHAADEGQLHNLSGGEVFLHREKRGFILFGTQVRNLVRPPNRCLLFVREQFAASPVVAGQQIDLCCGQSESSTELYVVAHSIVAIGQQCRFDDHQLLDLDVVTIGFEVVDADLLVE